MSDERLRELERRWKESGNVEDEAAYLLGRIREGELSFDHLQLIAALGYPAAQIAVGDQKIQGDVTVRHFFDEAQQTHTYFVALKDGRVIVGKIDPENDPALWRAFLIIGEWLSLPASIGNLSKEEINAYAWMTLFNAELCTYEEFERMSSPVSDGAIILMQTVVIRSVLRTGGIEAPPC